MAFRPRRFARVQAFSKRSSESFVASNGISEASFYKYKSKYGGMELSDAKKLRRICREEGLQVRKRGGRKRALGTRRPMIVPEAINQRWSLDFVSDAFADGRRLRIFAVVDDYSRECLGLIADTSISGMRVARELDTVITRRGQPAMIVSDNGTEFTSQAILRWSQESGFEWHYIARHANSMQSMR